MITYCIYESFKNFCWVAIGFLWINFVLEQNFNKKTLRRMVFKSLKSLLFENLTENLVDFVFTLPTPTQFQLETSLSLIKNQLKTLNNQIKIFNHLTNPTNGVKRRMIIGNECLIIHIFFNFIIFMFFPHPLIESNKSSYFDVFHPQTEY